MAAPLGNLFALGLENSGRPRVFENPDDLFQGCKEYFDYCNESNKKATITGLALYLGFESRQSIYDYKEKDEFSYIIKRACLAVENSYEMSGTTFDMFCLKNMGWKDKTEMDISGDVNLPVKEWV